MSEMLGATTIGILARLGVLFFIFTNSVKTLPKPSATVRESLVLPSVHRTNWRQR